MSLSVIGVKFPGGKKKKFVVNPLRHGGTLSVPPAPPSFFLCFK